MTADLGLRRRREDRLREPVGLAQVLGQRDSADLAGLAVLPEAGADEIAPSDTFDRDDLALLDEDAAAAELRMLLHVFGKLVEIGLEQMVLELGEAAEPEV